MYVNGTDNFLKYCKSHKLMNEMLDKFSWQVWVRELKEPQQKYSVDLEPKDKGWSIPILEYYFCIFTFCNIMHSVLRKRGKEGLKKN